MLLHIVLLMLGLEHNYSMPTASMQPTISIGDVFAMRTYRLYTVLGSSWFVPEPEIGDIVAVRSEFEPGAIFVKRVVAIGGDTVQMRAGRLYIDGELVERHSLGQFQDSDSTGTAVSVTRYEEVLPNEAVHLINEISDSEGLDDTQAIKVPAGGYFVIGDNRDRSADSRMESFGILSHSDLVAIVEHRQPIFFWIGGQ